MEGEQTLSFRVLPLQFESFTNDFRLDIHTSIIIDCIVPITVSTIPLAVSTVP